MVDVRPYPRVSTDEQKLTGYSLQAQRERLEAYVRAYEDWRIVDWYVDDGYSAKNLDRPAMKRLLSDLQRGDVVLVYKLDRLTRRVVDLEHLVKLFDEKGVVLRSVSESIDTSTANGRLFIRLIIEIAQWERETISERTSVGMQQRIASGGWKGGIVPFGYKAVPSGNTGKHGRELRMLVADEETAHIVESIFKSYVAGYGARWIARWLNDEVLVKTAQGSRWRSTQVTRLLKNPWYIGKTVKYHKDGTYTTYNGDHPALVDEGLFNEAQKVFAGRKLVAPRQATGEYLLSGVARCGVCGSSIIIEGTKKRDGVLRYFSYACLNHRNGHGCPGFKRAIPSQKTEENVYEAIRSLTETTNIERLVHEYESSKMSSAGVTVAEIARLREELRSIEQKIRRWDDAYETGELAWDKYQAKVAPLEAERTSLHERLAKVEVVEVGVPSVLAIAQFAEAFCMAWEHASAPERKALLTSFLSATGLRLLVFPDCSVKLLIA